MSAPNPRTSLRGKAAALSRSRTPDDPELLGVRRDLAAANIKQAIRRNLEAAPPLSPEQAASLADLLHAGATTYSRPPTALVASAGSTAADD